MDDESPDEKDDEQREAAAPMFAERADIEDARIDREAEEDEQAAWMDEPELADSQFGLRAMFALVTACGIYFFLERVFHGRFAAHALAAAGIAVGLAVPAMMVILWFSRLAYEADEPWSTLLLIGGIGGTVLAALLAMFGV